MARTVHEKSDLVPLLGEIFREYGFEGASLEVITRRTGLGKGSLYHFFPHGKTEMAQAVLTEIHGWFEQHVFQSLQKEQDLAAMFDAVEDYFAQGRRVCLVGVFALTETRDSFAKAISGYFEQWETCLRQHFVTEGYAAEQAEQRATDILITIQGGLTLSRARQDNRYFAQAMQRLRRTCGGTTRPSS